MIADGLNQTCTYWAPSGDRSSTDRYGKPTYLTPVQVVCRWEDKNSVVINRLGEDYVSKSRVFFAQDVELDGYLLLGVSTELDPRKELNALLIQGKQITPDLRNLEALTVAYL